MGKLVNVVLNDGTVATVSEEDAARISGGRFGREQTAPEAATSARADVRQRENSGIASKARAAVEGGLDTISAGGYGKLRDATADENEVREARDAAQVNPGSRLVGSAAAMLSPTGLLGDGAKAASELTALGAASRVGGALGGKLGLAAEGAIFGAGAHVADTNVTGDPLTIEGTVEAAGIGSLLNLGVGTLVKGLGSIGAKAGAMSDEAKLVNNDISIAKEGRELWKKQPESWDQFAEAVKGKQSAEQELYDQAVKKTEAHAKFLRGGKLDGEITKAENAINSVSRRWNEDVVLPSEPVAPEPVDASGMGFDVSDVGGAGARPADSSGLGFDTSDVPVQPAPSLGAPKPGGESELAGRTTREVMNTETGEYVTQVKQLGKEPAAPVDSRPPISKEMQGRLKVYRDRIRRIDQLRSGGFELDATTDRGYGTSEWVKKNPAVAPDPAKALEELRSLQSDLRREFPKATRKVKFGELPEAPPKIPAEPETLRLPKNLRNLALQKPETIQKLGNAVAGDQNIALAWQKVANELGVSAEDGIVGLHGKLGGYISAEGRLSAWAEKEASEKAAEGFSLVTLARKMARGMAVGGLGRVADTAMGGGLFGAGARALASEAGREGLTQFEDSALGGLLMRAKMGVQDKAGSVISSVATKSSKALNVMRPVTSYLGSTFPGGDKDRETDIRRLAINRTAEITSHALTVDDTMYSAVQGFLGHPSDVGWKVHQHVTSAVKYLAQTAPKDPGTVMHMFGSDWQPSQQDSLAFAYRLEAVLNPLDAVRRSIAGDGHPAATEALWTVWPNLMQALATEVSHHATQLRGLTYAGAQGYSSVFRAPLTGLQEPTVTLSLQSLYLPQPQQPQGGGGGSPSTGRPVGRPAAVQSPVAGTSVSNLISQ